MESLEDSPSSMWMIRAVELFPKAKIEKDHDQLEVPFTERKFTAKFYRIVSSVQVA